MDAADDVVAAAAGAVVVPFAVDQAARDGDGAAFGQVLDASVGLGAEGGHVDEHRLVFWSLTARRSWQTLRSSSSCFRTGVGGEVAERHQTTRSAAVWRTVEFSHWMLDLLLGRPSERRFREGLRDARLARLMSGGRFAKELAVSYVGPPPVALSQARRLGARYRKAPR